MGRYKLQGGVGVGNKLGFRLLPEVGEESFSGRFLKEPQVQARPHRCSKHSLKPGPLESDGLGITEELRGPVLVPDDVLRPNGFVKAGDASSGLTERTALQASGKLAS